MSEPVGIFGYGSLVAPASAGETLGREVSVRPARLSGWRRGWTVIRDNWAHEKSFAPSDGSEPFDRVLGLNVDPVAGAKGPNGAIIEVSEAELERLALRELRYEAVDVSDAVVADEPLPPQLFVFASKPAHRCPAPPADAVIIASYVRAVEAAFDALGAGELAGFRDSTGPPPVRIVEAELVRDEIPLGNPRDW